MPKWSRAIGKATAVPADWRGERIEVLPLRWATPSERKVVKAVSRASRAAPVETEVPRRGDRRPADAPAARLTRCGRDRDPPGRRRVHRSRGMPMLGCSAVTAR